MSDQIDDYPENYIGIEDLDVPIYRIFPLWYFHAALRLGQLVLVSPDLWEDKYEMLPWWCTRIWRSTGKSQMSHEFMHIVFAQCWSATKESDTLLKAYSRVVKDKFSNRNESPRDEGVTVCSTPRKLMNVLRKWAPENCKDCCFVGLVNYFNATDLEYHVGEIIRKHPSDRKISARQMAELLLLKRNLFEHENEVRIMYVDTNQEYASRSVELTRCNINPNEVFDSVKFDPRLADFERKEREQFVRDLQYKGKFTKSDLHTAMMLEILMD
jgi:hypothetical protein